MSCAAGVFGECRVFVGKEAEAETKPVPESAVHQTII